MFNRYNPQFGYNRTVRTARTPVALKHYDSDRVFAAAAAAQELNGEYLKYERRDEETGKVTHRPNKVLVHEFLENDFTEQELERGRAVRSHFQKLLFQQIAGELKDFKSEVLRVSTKETFANNDWLDFAIVASLPNTYKLEIARAAALEERELLTASSQPVGKVGDRIQGDFEIMQCCWSHKWNSWTVNARKGTDIYFFFHSRELTVGRTVQLRGTVKCYRDGKVTQLNRVKEVK